MLNMTPMTHTYINTYTHTHTFIYTHIAGNLAYFFTDNQLGYPSCTSSLFFFLLSGALLLCVLWLSLCGLCVTPLSNLMLSLGFWCLVDIKGKQMRLEWSRRFISSAFLAHFPLCACRLPVQWQPKVKSTHNDLYITGSDSEPHQ